MFSLNLPEKIKGQYWLNDIDEKGRNRKVISFEAIQNEWVIKSNSMVNILDAEGKVIPSAVLKEINFLNLQYTENCGRDANKIAFLFTGCVDASSICYTKYILPSTGVEVSFRIGRDADSNFFYNNKFVSGRHASLSYVGNGNWHIEDMNSTNGTYVNGKRIQSCDLKAGDCIYIMGLKIIIGHNYIATNNPESKLRIHSQSLMQYLPQKVRENDLVLLSPTEKEYFFRPPRFYREIEQTQIKIDAPPQPQKLDEVPMALMMGPSLTMGMTSMSTGILAVSNVINNGGSMTQALPSALMSVSMLLGTVLWPILTKKYEKKQRVKNENKRQEKYLAYLDQVRDLIRREIKTQSDILNENNTSPEDCLTRVLQRSTRLWERVIGQKDFLTVRLGVGKLPLNAEIKYPEKRFTLEDDNLQDAMLALGIEPKNLENVPVGVSLLNNIVVGVYGEREYTSSMLKTIILQLTTLQSYDELKIIMITGKNFEEEWNFMRYIPHCWTDDKTTRFFATSQDDVKELSTYLEKTILTREDNGRREEDFTAPYYVVIITDKELVEKCEALQKMLSYKSNQGFSILLVTEELKELPKETKVVIQAAGKESRMFDKADTTGRMQYFSADTMHNVSMQMLVDSMADVELDVSTQQFNLPNMVTFLEMFHVGKIEHLNSLTRWKENNPTKTLQTPVGIDTAGDTFLLDLHEKYHGPHGLVAGMTGSGKSEFIITYILSMAVNYHPDEVNFILIDYKGGGLTGAFEDETKGIRLPHLAGTITNLDGAAVKRSLISIQSELRRRQAIFNEARKISNEGTMDIYKYQQLYRDRIVKEPVPHLFIISDEFAELKTQQPEFMEQLISAARIGRSLGVHLILATQKPNGVVDDQIWSNSKFRVCLKVQEKADSQDMIKRPDAAELSQTGRFYLQVGFNEFFALGQSAWCGAEYIPSDSAEKEAEIGVQVVDNLGRVVMNVKHDIKRENSGNKVKQVVGIVKYLSDLALEEEISVKPLWLPPIPADIYIADLEEKYGKRESGITLNPIVGEYDDPFNQRQDVLTIPISTEGNCLIYGSAGNGKTTFLTTLCYSLIKNHTAEEVNLYLLDFGSETLKAFDAAPQVGGVVTGADEEKISNLFKLLLQQLEVRRSLFAEYGGDYASYCKNSGEIIPNIVVVLNNYSGFAEQYEDLQDTIMLLTRDGVKCGIYFVISASSTNAVRYKTAQNFKMCLTMQLNDASDYAVIMGKTEGLIPSRHKGRGLVSLERVYEFQTAYCEKTQDIAERMRLFSKRQAESSTFFAKRIPILPEKVTAEYVREDINSIKDVPIGVAKESLKIAKVNLSEKLIFPVVAQEIASTVFFAEEFIKVLCQLSSVVVIDMEHIVSAPETKNINYVTGEYELFVQELFADMVRRNNTYKDSGLDRHSMDSYKEIQFVIVGMKKLFDVLSTDGKDKLNILLEKGEAFYKLRFILVDSAQNFGGLSHNAWYRRHITGTEGLWIGDGIAEQYVLKPSKVTNTLYEEIGDDFGYLLTHGRPLRMKQLMSDVEGGQQDG